MFGKLGIEGSVSNLSLRALDTHGTGDYIGGLAGRNLGSITNCQVTGTLRGISEVGGIAGCNWAGNVTQCMSTILASGKNTVGGLVGYSTRYSHITDCGSVSTVRGDSKIGGLVGENNAGHVTKSYFKGTASGGQIIGPTGSANCLRTSRVCWKRFQTV